MAVLQHNDLEPTAFKCNANGLLEPVVKETVTTIVDNGNGTVTHTSEDGTVTTFSVGGGVTVNDTPIAFVPAATGNTTNLGEVVTDPDGNVWIIDGNGDAVMVECNQGFKIDTANLTTAAPNVASPLSIDDLTDVDTTTVAPSVGDTLGWDGTNFVPSAPSGGSIYVNATLGSVGGTGTNIIRTLMVSNINSTHSSNGMSFPGTKNVVRIFTRIGFSTTTGNVVITLFKNGVATAHSITLPAATIGYFESSAAPVVLSPGDYISLEIDRTANVGGGNATYSDFITELS